MHFGTLTCIQIHIYVGVCAVSDAALVRASVLCDEYALEIIIVVIVRIYMLPILLHFVLTL